MTSEIYELIFRGLKSKYPGQAVGPRFQAVCAALDEWDESKHPRDEDGKFGKGNAKNTESPGYKERQGKNKLELKISPKSKPVAALKGNEIAGNTLEDRVEAAWDYWGENLSQKKYTRKDLGEIKLFNSTAKEILGKNVNNGKLDLFPAIPFIYEQGKLVGEKKLDTEKRNGIKKFYYIQACIEVDGKPRYAQLDIGERFDGKRVYYLNEIIKK